ncbi:MAG TPA: rhodanese-like domain-containing protein [Polyangia bacterium]|jgi:rhodanese-related sulfurtransferase|nr:rhodanese-like domain-containing protein [Polyangia bacterium]
MPKRVVPKEAAALLAEGWAYLDVRSVPEFDDGHPVGAANVPLLHLHNGRMAPNPDFQRVVEATFAKDAKIVVGCKAGGRSLQAATLMESAGYTNVVDMRGGYHGERDGFGRVSVAGWAAEGLPVETAAAPEKTYETLAQKK